MKKTFFFLLSLVLLFSSCQQENKNHVLDFYFTSDVHGVLFPYDYLKKDSLNASLAHVSTFLNHQRSRKDTITLLLDNGDIIQGQPSVYFANFIDTLNTHLVARVMNYLSYDAASLGNHDIEAGHQVYDKLVDHSDFPWLAGNAMIDSTKQPYFQPYAFLIRSKIKIVVIGLITPHIPYWLPQNIYSGIEFMDLKESAEFWIKVAKEKHDPDIIIGLFHTGAGESNAPKMAEDAARHIAETVDGFNAVICGHDHRPLAEKIVSQSGDTVWLLNPGSRAQNLAHLSINLQWNEKKHEYELFSFGDLINVSDFVPDSGFINHFAKDIARIDAYVNEEIATLNDTLSTKNIFYKDNEFMDLIHNLQLKIGNAQISFAAPLQTKMNINPGKILMSELFNLYRYENLLYTMELSGLEIKNYLEYSYSLWINTMQSEKDTLLQFAENGQNLKNPGYNFDSAEGIDYTVDLTKKAGERIKIEKLSDGTKFELNTKYKVAINSYRGNGGGGHLTEGAGINRQDLSSRIVFSTEKDLRYYMMEYLKEIQNIDLQVNNNWRMIPEPWVSKAILRENNLVNK